MFAGGGSLFLWIEAPGGDDVLFAERCFEQGVLLLPGSWFDPPAPGYLRLALVEVGESVFERIEDVLQSLT